MTRPMAFSQKCNRPISAQGDTLISTCRFLRPLVSVCAHLFGWCCERLEKAPASNHGSWSECHCDKDTNHHPPQRLIFAFSSSICSRTGRPTIPFVLGILTAQSWLNAAEPSRCLENLLQDGGIVYARSVPMESRMRKCRVSKEKQLPCRLLSCNIVN